MIPSKEWFCWLLDSQSIYLSHAFSVNSHGVSFLNKLYTTIFHHYNALKLFLTNVAHTTHHQSPWDPMVYFPYPSLSSKTASLFSASCPTTFRFFLSVCFTSQLGWYMCQTVDAFSLVAQNLRVSKWDWCQGMQGWFNIRKSM